MTYCWMKARSLVLPQWVYKCTYVLYTRIWYVASYGAFV